MHIGFILTEYPHPKVTSHCGGIGTATHNIVLGLLKKNHNVSVFIYGQDNTETITEGRFTLYKIIRNKYKFGGWYLYRKQLNKYINRIVASKKINILEAPDWGGITAFMSFKVPIVLRLHGSDTYFCHLEKRKQKRKNYFFEKTAYKKADVIISVSQYTLELTEQLFGVKKTAIVIQNGLFLDNFVTSKQFKTAKNIVLYFGSLVRKKGVLELPYIFNELIKLNTEAQLIVIGRDVVDNVRNQSTLKLLKGKLSDTAQENFMYKGVLPYDKMRDEIAKASVCVFPSLAESFGMVTIEAMALEKAIVNTNYSWAKEIMIDGKTGFLEDPKHHTPYAQKINRLLTDDTLRITLGEKAHNHVLTNFSMVKLVEKNITFYKKIIDHEV
ncbi:MAG: glycosyltransferase family 4 protein [Flavobacteriaceae bacterium]